MTADLAPANTRRLLRNRRPDCGRRENCHIRHDMASTRYSRRGSSRDQRAGGWPPAALLSVRKDDD